VAIVFKDLQKLVSHSQSQQQQQKENSRKELFESLQGKPFWIWNIDEHKQEDIRIKGDCCFNHIIGLPQRNSCWVQLLTLRHYLLDLSTFKDQNSQPNSDHKRRRSWL
jgi:hypothetical protein